MGEEVSTADFVRGVGGGGNEDDERVMAWEVGLPGADDLTPLSQLLIPPELASAFNIKPEPYRTALDVNRASQTTLSSLRGGQSSPPSFAQNGFKSFNEINNSSQPNNVLMIDDNDNDDEERSDSRKIRRIGGTDTAMDEADSAFNSNDDNSARTLKRPRLVWTPQLHKRFVDVVSHLGIKSAVPKTIMQMMNVEGLTRENVASHLQKYRLYLKRMQGLSNEGPSSSDQLFATTPVPQNLQENGGNGHGGHGHGSNGHVGMPIQMQYGAPLMPMPMLGMGHHHPGHGQMGGMPHGMGGYGGMEAHHQHAYGMMQQREWPGNYSVSYPQK